MIETGTPAGVVPALVTPFTEDGDVDEGALRQEVDYMVNRAAVHGVVVTGSTGEGYALGIDELRRVAEVVLDEVGGTLPVIGGVIANSTREAAAAVAAVGELPVAGFQVTPVHYVFDPGHDGHVDYFRAVAHTAQRPIIIYNVVPWANLSVDLLLRVTREVTGVVAVKQSNRDLHKLAALIAANQELKVYTAVDDLLFPSFCLGAHGTICALAAVLPEQCLELWSLVQSGQIQPARLLHQSMLAVWRSLDAPDMPSRIKVAIRLLGRSAGYPRRPFREPAEQVVDEIRLALAALPSPVSAGAGQGVSGVGGSR